MIWPIPTTWLWAGALAAAVAAGGVQTARLAHRDVELARSQQEHAASLERLQAAATAATQAARDTEQRWQAQQQEALHVAQKSTDQARADAAAAHDAVGRLRQRAAAVAAAGCAAPAGAAAAGPGAPASSPADLLADVSGRLAEAGRQLAEHADRAVIAGQACEASWPR